MENAVCGNGSVWTMGKCTNQNDYVMQMMCSAELAELLREACW